ncbi:MAG: S9 family peptidase [Pseudomonadota bacterium]
MKTITNETTYLYAPLILALSLLMTVPSWGEGPSSPAELPLKAFAQLPLMQDVELSPDGTHIAFMYPIDGRNHIVIQPVFNADQRKVIPPPGELEFDWLRWANDERLVFVANYFDRRSNVETVETRLASIKRDGTDVKWIIKPAAPKSTAGSRLSRTAESVAPQLQDDVIDWLPSDPDHILVALDEDFDARWEVRKVNVNNGDYKIVRGGFEGVQNWKSDADHVVRLGWGYDQSEFKVIYLNQDGDWKSAVRTDWWDRGWRPGAFTDDPEVVIASGYDQGRAIYSKINISSGDVLEPVFSHDQYDADYLLSEGYTGGIVGVRYTSHFPQTKYFDAELDKLQRSAEKAFAGMNVQQVSHSADRKQLLIKVSSDNDPGVMYMWDRENKSMDVLSEMMPGLLPELLSSVKPISYAARDGYDIPGYLTLPKGKGDKNLPTVIMPHGGPSARDDQSFWFLSQFLASRGYAVLQPNFRGSTGYGAAHENAGAKQWGGLMQDDVTDAAKWIVSSGIADPERICIVGWSYGGYSAAMGAVKTPDLFRCAASINGVLDIPRQVNDGRKYVGGKAWSEAISLEGASLKDISPLHQAEKITIPMLIIQAKDDARVHKEQGSSMAKRLDKLGKTHTYITVDHGGHSMNNEPARAIILESVERFLDSNIGT